MLRSTFLHVPGIGFKTERELWERHVLSWNQFAKRSRLPGFSEPNRKKIAEYLLRSAEALEKKDVGFFAENLPKREWWRLYSELKESVAFLDIETTGLSRYYDDITMIGVFDGKDFKIFVKGQNLDDFPQEIQKYLVLVTFNGTLFDLPFLACRFKSLKLPAVHVDLRFFLRRLGYKGGLKAVEEKCGIVRQEEVQPIDGFGAAVLWNRVLRGEPDALKLLVEYNIADTINLKTLMDFGYHLMEERMLPRKRFSRKAKIPAIHSNFGVFVRKDGDSHLNLRVGAMNSLFIDLKVYEKGRIRIDTLLSRFEAPNRYPKVVGIDLSASEKRRTGWALLRGRLVETKLMKTDREIIDATLKAEPDLVSIDSPLSLPKGRDCTRDNCECRRFGITRECERLLRSRGIFIFPCLIQSMQPLTRRGVRLKNKLEKFGQKVIESYPGATQDILRIIRKKISIDELKQGLVDFGLTGNWALRRVSHDELDAVTSALVGYFFLTGKSEKIGNEEEGFLIIPRK